MSTKTRNNIESRTTTKGDKRYRGTFNSRSAGVQRGPWVGTRAEAAAWLAKARGEAVAGTRGPHNPMTVREAWESFYASAVNGTGTRTYRPSTMRAYKYAWNRVEPEIGAHRLTDVKRADLQALVDRWAAEGVPAATIRNSLDPVRAIFRGAKRRDLVAINPTTDLEVPSINNARERYATKAEATKLLAALPDGERALWATAFYAGLRRGELRALRWEHVDLAGKTIHVKRSWDDVEGDGPPKTKAAMRKIHIGKVLAGHLKAHQKTTGRSGQDLVFGRTASEPFGRETVRQRANKAWKDAKLDRIGLHECRHTFASWMIASGAEAKALSVVMGHESITITYDRYGKLMPGREAEVGAALDKYLDAA
jgi:integrase